VETINVHKGFHLVTQAIHIDSKKEFLWMVAIITFFLSSVLDNLTTTVVMISLIKKIVQQKEERLLIGGAIVIAANAGGAWTPIGDVTTTMLWIQGQITSLPIIRDLFLPSIACLVAATSFISYRLKGEFVTEKADLKEKEEPFSRFIFYLGVLALIFVPIFKILTGLPPFMGVLFGLSVLWIVTDLLHQRFSGRESLLIPQVLSRVDVPAVLFFLGILLCVNTLEMTGILGSTAASLSTLFQNLNIIAIFIGLISAVVDNVPLVAATIGMYKLTEYPPDSIFWQLVAYCAGTGGSLLLIGSAAGVVFMGIEKVDFFWYLKRISLPATLGYFAGIIVYLLIN
jgi:Na+/H+ antiporter NhaD/arsenite permease-like protein